MKQRQISKSPVDPDAGLFYKNERERMFCYSMNTACDKNGFVLGVHVSAGNVHDSVNFNPIFTQVQERFPELKFSRIDREGYRLYYWSEHLEEANHLRHTKYNKELYALRSQTIERVFADFKEKHGMRYTQYRGIKKVSDEAMLAFTCMNMKKIAN
ncbi:transposase [Clostridiaceae bacterium 35-E11]